MASNVIETYAGDSAPAVTFTIIRDDSTIVDLTGATVLFRIKDPRSNTFTNDAANTCTVTNPSGGVCVYTWNSAGTDCPTPGIYKAWTKITFSNGTKETYGWVVTAADAS